MTRTFAALSPWNLACSALAAALVVGGAAAPAAAQAEGKEFGVRGKVTVSPELLSATEWPVDASRDKVLRTPARSRRALGRPVTALTEPLPDLVVVVEGSEVNREPPPPRKLRVSGLRFSPAQALLPRSGTITIENLQSEPLTIIGGGTPLRVEPGQTGDLRLMPGDHTLRIEELPFASATVKVLERGQQLMVSPTGEIPFTPLSDGDYMLSFYLGANALRAQPLLMPARGLLYIEATVSARGVVDVSVKDASVRVAVPPSLPPPPQAPPEGGG